MSGEIVAILLVASDHATCGNCGGGTDIQSYHHANDLPWNNLPKTPCLARFNRLAVENIADSPVVMAMRPDLVFIGVGRMDWSGDEARYFITTPTEEVYERLKREERPQPELEE